MYTAVLLIHPSLYRSGGDSKGPRVVVADADSHMLDSGLSRGSFGLTVQLEVCQRRYLKRVQTVINLQSQQELRFRCSKPQSLGAPRQPLYPSRPSS